MDIDIDFPDRDVALVGLCYVPASEQHDDKRKRHPVGVYFQDVPVDPLDGMAVWDYDTCRTKGYFKLDFLVNRIYQDIRDEAHLIALLEREPPWHRLADPSFVEQLAHVAGHFDILQAIQPTSIGDLAVCIALIRPGKAALVKQPRHLIDAEIWQPTDKYHFKKAHATSYAASIVVQMNHLVELECQVSAIPKS